MKLFLSALLALIFAVLPVQVSAQQTSDVTSTSDASNTGVQLDTGGNDTRAWSLLFPSVNPAMSTGTECATHGTLTWGVVWNFFHISIPQHGFDQDCAVLRTVDFYGRKCMLYTAKVMMDTHARKLGVAPEKQTRGDLQAYDQWVIDNFKDQKFEDCVKPVVPPAPVIEFVPVPSAGPASAPTPVVKTKVVTMRSLNLDSVTLFRSGKFDLSAAGQTVLAKSMEQFNNKSDIVALVEGHTDDLGSHESNQVLSEKRASSVGAYLESLGFKVEQTMGHGESKPLFPGKDATARAGNRRTMVTVRQITEEIK